MKSLSAFRISQSQVISGLGLLVITCGSVAAQMGPHGGSLGGNGLALRGMTNPLGGIAGAPFNPAFRNVQPRLGINPGINNRGFNNGRRQVYGFPYAYSVWVPDYFNYLNDMSQYYGPSYAYSAPYGVLPATPVNPYDAPGNAPSSQPVIINQYFNSPGPSQPAPGASPSAPDAGNVNTRTPDDPIGLPQNYYLIAYKNHEIYSVISYWLEDKTLHYVTTQNTHNQASLDLIDLMLTKSLNQDREVPFSIPGQ